MPSHLPLKLAGWEGLALPRSGSGSTTSGTADASFPDNLAVRPVSRFPSKQRALKLFSISTQILAISLVAAIILHVFCLHLYRRGRVDSWRAQRRLAGGSEGDKQQEKVQQVFLSAERCADVAQQHAGEAPATGTKNKRHREAQDSGGDEGPAARSPRYLPLEELLHEWSKQQSGAAPDEQGEGDAPSTLWDADAMLDSIPDSLALAVEVPPQQLPEGLREEAVAGVSSQPSEEAFPQDPNPKPRLERQADEEQPGTSQSAQQETSKLVKKGRKYLRGRPVGSRSKPDVQTASPSIGCTGEAANQQQSQSAEDEFFKMHPYYRVSTFAVGAAYRLSNLKWVLRCSFPKELDTVDYLERVRQLLTRPSLDHEETKLLLKRTTELIGHAMRTMGSRPMNMMPGAAVKALGLRLLVFDAALAVQATVVYGFLTAELWAEFAASVNTNYSRRALPTDSAQTVTFIKLATELSQVLQEYKYLRRPSAEQVVALKRKLLDSLETLPLFGEPRFDPWRVDDRDYTVKRGRGFGEQAL